MEIWSAISKRVRHWTNFRIALYWSFTAFSINLLAVSFYFWAGDVVSGGLGATWRDAGPDNWFLGHVSDILKYFLPDFFNNIIDQIILNRPIWGGGLIAVIVVYYALREAFRLWSANACEKARRFILAHMGRLD